MDREQVLKLANLARVDISTEEAESLSNEFDSILKYVGEIKNAKLKSSDKSSLDLPVRNVFREDANPHESGLYTEAVMREAPKTEGGFVVVKKIL